MITEAPTESATWEPGFLPSGSYEILVFYRQACDAPAGPVDFTLTITVNGQALEPIAASLPPPPADSVQSVYLASFVLSVDATATANPGGYYPDSSINQLPTDPQTIIDSATPVEREVAVEGAIFAEQTYQTYSFDAASEEVITISMTATSGSLDTLLQLVGPNGNIIAVNDDFDGTNATISNVRIIQSGTYTIVATRYGKDVGGTEGDFVLLVSESSATLPASVANLNLPEGDVQVFLTWNTNADLQLLVRDPVGQAIYDDEPRANSGGLLAADGNVGCTVSEGDPVSYIYWPRGLLRPGTYEVEIWFQNTCDDTRPVEFTLTVAVNGEVIAVESRVHSIGDRFVMNFVVNQDGTAQAGLGGFVSTGSTVLDIASETALPIQPNVPANGSLTVEDPYNVYSFLGTAGQVVTISMETTQGTLDTSLYLISPGGVEIAANDDADPALVTGVDGRTTDSLINAFTLPETGEYRIIATRFATIYGGTEGGYQLLLQVGN